MVSSGPLGTPALLPQLQFGCSHRVVLPVPGVPVTSTLGAARATLAGAAKSLGGKRVGKPAVPAFKVTSGSQSGKQYYTCRTVRLSSNATTAQAQAHGRLPCVNGRNMSKIQRRIKIKNSDGVTLQL